MEHQACAWPHYPRCDGNRPQSSWMDIMWLCPRLSCLLAPRVLWVSDCHLRRCELSGRGKTGDWRSGVGGVPSSCPGSWTQHNDHHYIVCKCISLCQTLPVRVFAFPLTTSRQFPPKDRHGCNGTNWAGHHRGTAVYSLWQNPPPCPFYICKIWSQNVVA